MTTTRLSTASDGSQGDSFSENPVFSPDGSAVAFDSVSSNLVANDTNASYDVFIKSLTSGIVTRVSTSADGSQANGLSDAPAFSGNGREVVFYSEASNLVTRDANGVGDVFVKDLTTGAVTLVSAAADGTQGNKPSGRGAFAVLSPDGTKVAFESDATNLVAGDTNGTKDIFLKDLATGALTRVSTAADGTQGDGDSASPVFSPDGTKIAFASSSSNLVANDTNGAEDVFVKDLATGAITRVSMAAGGVQLDGNSLLPSFSSDGSKLAFESFATNVVPGDTNGREDVFVLDLTTASVVRASVGADGTQGNADSSNPFGDHPEFSPNGTLVAFSSEASNFVASDTNNAEDVFVKNLATGALTRVSVDTAGVQGDGFSLRPSFSPDGTEIAFASYATNLVAGDSNDSPDIFLAAAPSGQGAAQLFAFPAYTGTATGVWVTDGTMSGTHLIKTYNAGSGLSFWAAVGNGQAIFNGSDGSVGREPYVTDGTAAGTHLLKDLNPGTADSYPMDFTPTGSGKVVFEAIDASAGHELWATDGSASGTSLIKDIDLGAGDSNPDGFFSVGGGRVLFRANDGTHGVELWRTDGTTGGTALVRDISPAGDSNPGTSGFALVGGGHAVFDADDGQHGVELWITDGSEAGTSLLKDINPGSDGSDPTHFASIGNGKALFSATDGQTGEELWITDGTAVGTQLLKDINPGPLSSAIGPIVPLGDGRFVFDAFSPVSGTELWITDGTSDGTRLLADIDPGEDSSYPFDLTPLGNGKVVFTALDAAHGTELWVTDGSTTQLVDDIKPGPDPSNLRYFKAYGTGIAFFQADQGTDGNEPWVTDGTPQGTFQLIDANPGAPGSQASDFTPVRPLGTSPPTAITLSITGVSGSTNLVDMHVISGTIDAVHAGLAITVRDAGALVGSTNADTSGAWSLALPTDLADGFGRTYSLTASAHDGSGTTGTSSSFGYMLDFTPNLSLFGSVAHDAASHAGEVYGLFDGLLGRPPDNSGWEAFVPALDHGASLRDVAQAVLTSPEWTSRFGDVSKLDDKSFVDTLYHVALGRDVDTAGEQGWLATLANGASRADVGVSFALSAENEGQIAPALSTGVFAPDAAASSVARLYEGLLHRSPDASQASGLPFWDGKIAAGASLLDVATGFAASPEYAALHPAGETDQAYVKSLYEGALGRSSAGDSGAAAAIAALFAQSATRADVAVGVTNSAEAQAHLAGHIEAGWHLA